MSLPVPEVMEKVIAAGDLSSLTAQERVSYYGKMCESLGLNPLTRPFQYIVLKGKLTLYAAKDCTEQLRKNHRVSITGLTTALVGEVYVVTAIGSTPDGRSDSATGAVSVQGMRGDDLANAYMKAETKAKRRLTLSLCGLGVIDESEVDSIKEAIPYEEPNFISEEEEMYLRSMLNEAQMTEEEIKEKVLIPAKIEMLNQLTVQQTSLIIKKLEDRINRQNQLTEVKNEV